MIANILWICAFYQFWRFDGQTDFFSFHICSFLTVRIITANLEAFIQQLWTFLIFSIINRYPKIMCEYKKVREPKKKFCRSYYPYFHNNTGDIYIYIPLKTSLISSDSVLPKDTMNLCFRVKLSINSNHNKISFTVIWLRRFFSFLFFRCMFFYFLFSFSHISLICFCYLLFFKQFHTINSGE